MAELVDRDDGADTPHENEGRAPPPPVPRNKKKGKGKKKAAPTLTSEAQRREELQQLVARMRRSRVQDDPETNASRTSSGTRNPSRSSTRPSRTPRSTT